MPSKLEIECLPRIRSYTLLLSQSIVDLLRNLEAAPADSKMEHLAVLHKPSDPGRYTLPDVLFAGGRSPLKSLLVFQCWVNLDLVSFSDMQVLEIETERPEGELWRTSGQ